MTTSSLQRLMIAFLLVCAVGLAGRADSAGAASAGHRNWDDHQDSNLVSIGHDSTLAAGEHAESVVSIFGSSTSAGEVVTVVSVFGDTKVTGTALDAAAIVHGGVQDIFAADFGGLTGLRTWITHCLLFGRPLGLVSGIGWAWGLALGFLAFYVCLALLCRPAVDRCVQTFERQPGQTLLAAIVAMLLWPVLLVLLCVTLIGIAAVPFVIAAIVCAVLFGKAVMLAWIGGRITGQAALKGGHPAFAVLVGGAVVLVLYVVPVLGFLVYNLLGILGFGAVVYTLILAGRARQAAKVEPAPAGVSPASIDAAAPASTVPPSAEPAPPAPEQPQA